MLLVYSAAGVSEACMKPRRPQKERKGTLYYTYSTMLCRDGPLGTKQHTAALCFLLARRRLDITEALSQLSCHMLKAKHMLTSGGKR